jgi:hypothetical protein
MNNWQHWPQISRLIDLPLNKAAEKLLPPDWTDPGNLHVLSLALWGTQHGIYPRLDSAPCRNAPEPQRLAQAPCPQLAAKRSPMPVLRGLVRTRGI